MDTPDYPPQPWHLRGQAYVSAWRLPARSLPALPSGIRPVVLGGNGIVLTAWVDYQPGGVLAYSELMATVAVWHGRRVAASITDIWVDSPASLAGGRALWHIPKEPADFELTHGPFAALARTADGVIAESSFRPGPGLPVRLPAGFSVLQEGVLRSPVRVSARMALARSRWRIEPSGPLGFLHGRVPFASFAVRDFRMRFGS